MKMFLRELKSPPTDLPGIGPRTAELLANLSIRTVADLLLHLPRDYEDRRHPTSLEAAAREGKPANTVVRVASQSYFGKGRRRTLKVTVEEVEEPNGSAALICFGRSFLSRTLIVGGTFYLFGAVSYRYGELQSTSFEIEPFTAEEGRHRAVHAIYPLTAGVTQGILRRAMHRALDEYGAHVEDELPPTLIERRRLPSKARALRSLHLPESVEEASEARRALAFEELFYLQLAVGRRAQRRAAERRTPTGLDASLQEALRARLPFRLTADQEQALSEINRDLSSTRPMARLLQGEVGSGKTLVALFASLGTIGGGRQAALMAPTELLARQHAETAARLLAPLGVRLAFLSGNVKDPSRGELLRALREGSIDLIIGTHALFSRSVLFARLGLVVVDEQHRFGVLQRLAITQKGRDPDLLLMTATPIPRTLALTAFGDLDVSTIRTMPPGRRPVETHLVREGNLEKVYTFVRRCIAEGRQAYFVYPLIEQSEAMDLKDAESMYEELSTAIFPDRRIGLIHSRVDEEEKSATMERFVGGQIDLLVATSVIEVGVDVPNASVIVVHHAERFGLAALHQLRGRVGRGAHSSYAFLVYSEPLSDEGKRRLKVMKESADGFVIAEEDLRLRGPGEVAGTRQSGLAGLEVADLVRDLDLLAEAREEAFAVLAADPGLLEAPNRVIREVLARANPFAEEMFQGG